MPLNSEHFSLLGKISDSELALEAGLSRERIRQIREKNNIPKYNGNIEKEKIIIDYLKNNPTNIHSTCVRNYTGITYINGIYLSTFVLKKLADTYCIQCTFINDEFKFDHGCKYYETCGCKCEICKLANCIKNWIFRNFQKSNSKFVDYISNNYIDFYRNDQSRYKKNFFNFIRYEFTKYLDAQEKS